MLLGIDTSTHYASVALHDGERLLSEHTWLASQDHTRTLLPNVQRLFDDARVTVDRLTGVAVALGPGSFNGLRVGLSTAKGFALANGLALVGVPTLELLAAEYQLEEVTMNAGRARMYVWRKLPSPAGAGEGQGEGSPEVQLEEGTAPDRVRHAGVLCELAWRRLRAGEVDDPAKLEPLYVRPPHITESRKKSHMQAA